jgi:predicted  nucleic acid-binding Zn-ribbon protein
MTTPTTTPGAILRELHRLRRHAKDLQNEMERLPRQLNAQKGKVVRQEEALKNAQEAIKKLKVSIHEKETTLKAKHQEIVKREKQRNENVANKKEYDALGHEIAAARQLCDQLEDQALAALTEVDEKTARLPELEKALKQAKDEVANFDTTCKKRQAELAEMIKGVQQNIQEMDATLPDDVRAQYQRLVGFKGEDAISEVQGRTCVACYTGITAQQQNELLQGQFVVCKNCGRILYLAE